MSEKACKIVFFVLLLNLALIGVVGYGLEGRKEPIGVLFLSKGGPVVFDHRLHVLHGGPGLENCKDCHHDTKDGETTEKSCRACHYYGEKPFRREAEKIHKRCIGAKCASCHIGKECSYCHSP